MVHYSGLPTIENQELVHYSEPDARLPGAACHTAPGLSDADLRPRAGVIINRQGLHELEQRSGEPQQELLHPVREEHRTVDGKSAHDPSQVFG